MKKVLLRPKAEADIDAIWNYTSKRWGRTQANHYVGEIRKAISAVADQTRSSRSADDIRKDYRKTLVGQHTVFFRDTNGTVEVIRVLHQRMDFEGKV